MRWRVFDDRIDRRFGGDFVRTGSLLGNRLIFGGRLSNLFDLFNHFRNGLWFRRRGRFWATLLS